MKGGTPLLAISTSCIPRASASVSRRDEFGAKTQRAAEAGMHRMQQMFLKLICADAQHCADQRRHAARHPRHRDLQIGDGVEPGQCGIVDGLSQQFVIQRADRAERLAAAPGRDIEILQMRAAAVIYAAARLRPDAEQRIGRGEGAGAGRPPPASASVPAAALPPHRSRPASNSGYPRRRIPPHRTWRLHAKPRLNKQIREAGPALARLSSETGGASFELAQ